MGRYLLKRLVQALPVLFGITLICFSILHLAPGDPALLFIDRSTNPTQEDIDRVRHDLGLDKPVPIQYVNWITRAVQGDLGTSFIDRRPVTTRIKEMMPYTLTLSLLSLGVGYTLAIILGVLAAVRVNTWVDWLISSASAFLVSVPNFWVALMAILLFSIKLDLVPTSGWETYGDGSIWDVAKHLVLPVMLLASRDISGMSRYVRSGLLEVLNQDYVRTARAKGLSGRVVVYKHALRNALIPVVTLLGLSLPILVGGAVVTESVFTLPGMGRMAVGAVSNRDYPLVLGINLVLSLMTVAGNIVADLAYGWVDPRIRYS
ncbi:MAG TPA: ABC transporter permease [Symbiobacteriaceae bacterium]|nr:ABC transporter permease [Symbiobacteriaceae bacterium]